MVPDQQGDHPHILVQAGKEGRIVVLNRDNLGGYAPGGTSNTNALQDIPGQIGGCWSTPAYWKEMSISGPQKDAAKVVQSRQWRIEHRAIQPVNHDFAISQPILFHLFQWRRRMALPGRCGRTSSTRMEPNVLYAWDANDLTNTIYESDTNAKRDAGGPANQVFHSGGDQWQSVRCRQQTSGRVWAC